MEIKECRFGFGLLNGKLSSTPEESVHELFPSVAGYSSSIHGLRFENLNNFLNFNVNTFEEGRFDDSYQT